MVFAEKIKLIFFDMEDTIIENERYCETDTFARFRVKKCLLDKRLRWEFGMDEPLIYAKKGNYKLRVFE